MGRGGLTARTRSVWVGLAAAGLIVLPVGCGSRTPAPRLLIPGPPGGFQLARFPQVGLRMAIPRDWATIKVSAPLVTLVTSGSAVVALWRYPTSAPAPRSMGQLRQALRRLLAAARHRDPALRVLSFRLAPAAGYPAVELETDQRVGHEQRRVYSTHLFGPGEEVVLEQYAPANLFPTVDRSVFSAVRRSLAALTR